MVSAEVRLEVERLCETGLESSTDMVIYDTERADSAGNAPVKAVLAQRTRRQERSQERAGGQETRLASLESEQQRDSTAAARQETSEKTSRKTGKTPTACALLVMAALAAAGYIVYKRKTKQT